jgi:uncharacterized membrane protein YcaP (DUF421 family)
MEIVVRAAAIFVFLWFVTRAVGRTTLGELSTFELVLYVTMGDLVQQGVTQQDYSVTAAVLAIGTFALLTVGLGYVAWRFPRLRRFIHGTPVVIVRSGEPVREVMRQERLTLDELRTAAREQGIRTLADVDLAVLENDGKLSFFQQSDSQSEPREQPELS